MKRGWKIFWITCAVVLVAGIICCITSLILGVTREAIADVYYERVGDNAVIDTEDDESIAIEEDSGVAYSEIRKIDAEFYAGTVLVKSTTDDNVIVEISVL